MSQTILTSPYVTIENNTYPIKPNSFKMTLGLGEATIAALSTGGGGIETVGSVDLSTKIGKCEWEFPVTVEMIDVARAIKQLSETDRVGVQVFDPISGRTYSFTNALMTSDVEATLGHEEYFPVMMESDPVKF